MSTGVDAIVARGRWAASPAEAPAETRAGERQRLERLASEFESMLLGQMLREMRRASRWDEGREEGGMETQSLFEMLDAELAVQLTRVQGLGLSKAMLGAFDRGLELEGEANAPSPAEAVALPGAVPSAIEGANWLQEAPVTSAFGWRADPLTGGARFHRGIDVKAAYGQEVAAAAGGRVVFSGESGGYGLSVVIEHAGGTRSRYAHLSASLVSEGQQVAAGAVVGRVGQSGRATGPHLHFEILDQDGTHLDPLRMR